jgi:hypothetical protein
MGLKPRDLANLLNRAAAALETPDDLTPQDKADLIEDLVVAAKEAANEQ